MDIIKKHLEEILNDNRYKHSLQVASTAVKLAKIYKVDERKAEIAGLLHDCGKNISLNKMKQLLKINNQNLSKEYFSSALLHGFAGSIYARNVFRIEDKDILDAIKYHTVGRKNMNILEKIIYISDVIEPDRRYSEKINEIRKKAYIDIDEAILEEVNDKILFLLESGKIIHPNTIELRNQLIYKRDFSTESLK